MISWINFFVLLFSSLFFLYFYVISVSPATREKVIGPVAYQRCGRDRLIAALFESIAAVCYVIFIFYPLESPLPLKFPWAYWISALIAALIGLPALGLMFRGMRDAGAETLSPEKRHTMYTGIYTKIRHPQAVGEVFIWLVMALLLNSPFLALFSLLYFPIFMVMCFAEEQDLIWRYGDDYVEYLKNTGAFWPKRG